MWQVKLPGTHFLRPAARLNEILIPERGKSSALLPLGILMVPARMRGSYGRPGERVGGSRTQSND
jgi:hypothetical protein